MNRFRLATWAALAGVSLAAGCASPCGGCGGGGGMFQRMSLFRARGVGCPCETCGCGGGGVPVVGAGGFAGGAFVGDGPLLGEPHGPALAPGTAAPPFAGVPATPSPLPPNLGAPFAPSVPAPDAGRLTPIPIPNSAQPVPAEGSSRRR